jgi:all-trans-retinol 13,14-reductase
MYCKPISASKKCVILAFPNMKKYDVVIIGSGIGGLLSAVILAKAGKRVVVLEQQKQIGGCLQTFAFQKKVFDSCVHYISAMDEGQVQHQLFKYAGIIQHLKVQQLDKDGFDRILMPDGINYPIPQGIDHFVESLSTYFPASQAALQQYANTIVATCDKFPLFHLKNGDTAAKQEVLHWNMQEVMQHIPDARLRQVLLGNNLLYAGSENNTPFYIHALVNKSFIDSAYKCVGGSSQIAKYLRRSLMSMGGEVYTHQKVTALKMENGLIADVVTDQGQQFQGHTVVANVHPAQVIKWLPEHALRKLYTQRIAAAPNSISAFMVNVVLKPGTVPHRNHNIYWNKEGNCYAGIHYKLEDWPNNFALYFNEDAHRPGFSESVAILTYMHAAEVKIWQHTYNTAAQPTSREESYQDFKAKKAAVLLQVVGNYYPELLQQHQSHQAATPLTFKDYMGTSDGSMYGIMANVNQPLQTTLTSKTKIPNLYLTGQNIGVHGVYGVSVNAVATCGEILGLDYLLSNINKV